MASAKYVSLQMARQLADLCPVGYRELILWAAGTGFRVGDLVGAHEWAYDRKEKSLQLREEKTGKYRTATVPDWLCADFDAYDKRHPFRLFLVEQPEGGPISRQTAWRWVHRAWLETFGKSVDRLGPHSFRKCYAVEQRRAGKTLAAVQKDLNHSNRATTMLYYYADQLE